MKVNRTYTIFFSLLLFILTVCSNTFGQGCSDAGACSIGSLDDMEENKHRSSSIKFSIDQSLGLGEKFVFISTTSLITEFRFTRSTTLTASFPFVFVTGNLGNTTGVGDMLVSFVQQLFKGQRSQMGLLVGGRLKTNNSDFDFGGNPLPMAYQTSLGTYDLITGVQYRFKTWDFYLAYQHPFGRNNNQYLQPESEMDESKLYYESAQLKRGPDLAIRVQKAFILKREQTLNVGALPIYRLQKSEIIKNDQPEILAGSDGLTFNLYVSYSKKIRDNTIISLTGAFPVIDKDYRADGLTRNFVLSFRITNLW